jgi:L-arabinose isomerase
VHRELEAEGLDGLLVAMLTYGPAMRLARLLAETRPPICPASVQPVPAVSAAWDMADLTYNQGIHGAQDTANAMVRAGRAST